MQLHIFQGLDKQGNILLQYSKFCKRPTATKPYKHLMNLLEKDKIYMVQVEPTETYCSF
jgi:hypothetical protein